MSKPNAHGLGRSTVRWTKLKNKVAVKATVQIDAYSVIERAVEEGVRLGWARAHKHTNKPSKEHICDAIEEGVMSTIGQYVNFLPAIG